MDMLIAVLLGILLYAVLCVLIAILRMLFSEPTQRKDTFGKTFRALFLEVLNPFHWFG